MNPDNPQQPQAVGPDIQKLEEDLKNLEVQAQTQSQPQPTPVDQPVVSPLGQPAVAVANSGEASQQIVNSNQPPVAGPKKSPLLLLSIILVAISLIATLIYIFGSQFLATQKACTMEAKICPDGSSVGRTGPNCEFTTCPVATVTPIETPIIETSPSASPVMIPTSSPSASPSI
jgi:hypothetical protein